MFTWINKAGVRRDDGFEFEFTGLFTAEYREAGRTLEIYVDGDGHGSVTIFDGSLDPLLTGTKNPFEKKSERTRMINNIREAVEFQGLRLHVISGPEPGLHSLK